MARTAPVPNIPPIPGMCPSLAVLAGGGDGGGGSGNGAGDGDGSADGSGDGSGNDASGDGANGGTGCGDPVCPVTGRVFLNVYDFGFPGPLPLKWTRAYSSRTSDRSGELGHGWSHTYGWTLREGRKWLEIVDDAARVQRLDQKPWPDLAIQTGLGWTVAVHDDSFRVSLKTGETLTFRRLDTSRHVLVGVHDRNGNTIVVDRDATGRLVGLRDSAGRPYRVSTDAEGRILTIGIATDASAATWSEVVRYAYDADGNLASAVDAEGFEARYQYERRLMVEHRSVTGLTYFYRYDGTTNDASCVETWGEYPGKVDPALESPPPSAPPRGERDTRTRKGIHHYRFVYDKPGRYTEVTGPLGGVDRYFGDSAGRIIKHVDAAGGVHEKAYSPDSGSLIAEIPPNNAAHRVLTDEDGIATGFADLEGQGASIRHLGGGVFERTDSRTGVVTRHTFDSRGNKLAVDHADGSTESYVVDGRGLLTRSVDRRGATTLFTHDAAGNLVEIRHPDGSAETCSFDYWGRRVAHVDHFGAKTEWAWDRRHQPVLKRHPDGTEIRVQWDGLRTPLVVDDAGRVTRYEYGGVGWRSKIVDPDGTTTEIRYDALGHVVTVTNGRGQTHKQTWDHASRPVACKTFEDVDWRFGYDATGLRWVRSPAGRRNFERNERGQVVSVEAQSGESWSVTYSKTGLFEAASNGMADIACRYDVDDRLVEEKQGSHTTKITWSADRPALIASDVGVPLEWVRDTAGKPAVLRAGNGQVRVGMADGSARLTLLGDHLILRDQNTPANQLELRVLCKRVPGLPTEAHGRQLDGSEVLEWTRYAYDQHHQLRKVERSNGEVTDYELTPNGQVAVRRVHKNGRTLLEERIAYDAAGSPRLATSYDPECRPTAIGADALSYDAAGRLVERRRAGGVVRYEWNAVDELVRVTRGDRVVEMDYDSEGRRVRKRVRHAGELVSATSWVWAGHTVLHEVDDLAKRTRTFLREEMSWTLLGHVDSDATGERHYYYVTDSSGAVDRAVDASGKSVFACERTVFGSVSTSRDDVGVTARFVNQFWDADVGLVYNDQRWYDPELGGYVTPDPLLLKGTLNPRDYVVNPTGWIDPLGTTRAPAANPASPSHGHPRRPGRPAGSPDDYSLDYLTRPGYNATNGTPERPGHVPWDANPSSRSFGDASDPTSARSIIDRAGDTYGCHSCGRDRDEVEAEDGSFNHWVPDHQPPISLMNAAGASSNPGMRLYPQCPRCSSRQGGLLGGATREGTLGSHSGRVTAGMATNAANSGRHPRPPSGVGP